MRDSTLPYGRGGRRVAPPARQNELLRKVLANAGSFGKPPCGDGCFETYLDDLQQAGPLARAWDPMSMASKCPNKDIRTQQFLDQLQDPSEDVRELAAFSLFLEYGFDARPGVKASDKKEGLPWDL